jgi:hypothetical protein
MERIPTQFGDDRTVLPMPHILTRFNNYGGRNEIESIDKGVEVCACVHHLCVSVVFVFLYVFFVTFCSSRIELAGFLKRQSEDQ